MSNYYDDEGMRKEPYVEDSTKGDSLIKPLNYKQDVLSQAWIDSRVLATLSNWMRQNGVYPRSMSEVVRKPLEMLVEMLVSDGKVEMVEDTGEARALLQVSYGVKLNRGNRGGKNILHNQILGEQRRDIGNLLSRRKAHDDTNVPLSESTLKVDTSADWERAKLEKQKEMREEFLRQKEASIKMMRESGMFGDVKSEQSKSEEKPLSVKDIKIRPLTLSEQQQKELDERKYLEALNAPLEMPDYLKDKGE